MYFRTRRQRRYFKLRELGFLKGEAFHLSKVPFRVPYMDVLMRDRFRKLQEAVRAGKSRKQFEDEIRKWYVQNYYFRMTKRGPRLDPWKMLRDFEHAYRKAHPEYTSPWEKRRRKFRDFMQKAEKTLQKYREQWIKELEENIKKARGTRRQQLIRQRDRLLGLEE